MKKAIAINPNIILAPVVGARSDIKAIFYIPCVPAELDGSYCHVTNCRCFYILCSLFCAAKNCYSDYKKEKGFHDSDFNSFKGPAFQSFSVWTNRD